MGKIRLSLCGWYSGFRKQSFTLWVLSSVFCFWTRLSHPSLAVHCVDSPYDLCIPHTPIKMKLFPKEATHRYTLALSGWSIKSAWCRAVSQKRWAWTESRRWASERGSPERERNECWAAGGWLCVRLQNGKSDSWGQLNCVSSKNCCIRKLWGGWLSVI